MAGTKLIPEKITSPFQLMAAWFSMLVLLVSILLAAAVKIERPEWAAGFLVLFSAVVVIGVFACVTLMLTKYRPHLQDGKEYAQWLKGKNAYSEGIVLSTPKPPSRKIPADNQQQNQPAKIDKTGYLISVVNITGAAELVKNLSASGFNAEIHKERLEGEVLLDANKQESIWIGERVPATLAIEAIQISAVKWPHLKYLHMSGDGDTVPPDYVHDQIFIGGSSSTAEDLGLAKWTNGELRTLTKTMSNADFHKRVRDHYI